jgi:hypothetical protein
MRDFEGIRFWPTAANGITDSTRSTSAASSSSTSVLYRARKQAHEQMIGFIGARRRLQRSELARALVQYERSRAVFLRLRNGVGDAGRICLAPAYRPCAS